MPFGTTHIPVTGYPYPLPKSTPTSNGEGVGRKLITHYKWGGYKMYPWGIFIIYYKVNYLLDMGGIGEGKKWIIIIWIWVWTRVGLPIPSPVADIYSYAHGRCWCLLFDVHLFFDFSYIYWIIGTCWKLQLCYYLQLPQLPQRIPYLGSWRISLSSSCYEWEMSPSI